MATNECRKYEDNLADLAEGKSMPAAQAHVESCQKCAAKVASLRTLLATFAVKRFDAPASAVSAAIGLFQPSRPTTLARLTQVGAGARGAATAEVIQVTREAGSHCVRLMLKRVPEGWDVFGQIDGPSPLSGYCGDDEIHVEDRRFEVRGAQTSDFLLLEFDDALVSVPLSVED